MNHGACVRVKFKQFQGAFPSFSSNYSSSKLYFYTNTYALKGIFHFLIVLKQMMLCLRTTKPVYSFYLKAPELKTHYN